MAKKIKEKKRIIFCVEDEIDIRTELINELTHAGFEVMSAGSGEEAIAMLANLTPEIIICDILMPGFGGLDLFRNVRANLPHLDGTPFIFLSALADRTHVLQGLKLGADDYLTKPIDFEVLEMKILSKLHLLERAKSSKTSMDSVIHGRLTPRENQVLVELVNGHTNANIAKILSLSEHTVGDHVKGIYRKLQVTSRSQAIREALNTGLVTINK